MTAPKAGKISSANIALMAELKLGSPRRCQQASPCHRAAVERENVQQALYYKGLLHYIVRRPLLHSQRTMQSALSPPSRGLSRCLSSNSPAFELEDQCARGGELPCVDQWQKQHWAE